jgi:hypothetical protein
MIVEVLGSSETSVITRAIRHNIIEDGILHCPENMGASTSHNPLACIPCYRDSFIFITISGYEFSYDNMSRDSKTSILIGNGMYLLSL